MRHHRSSSLLVLCLGAVAVLSACTADPDGTGTAAEATTISVTSTDTECLVSADTAPAGNVTFSVENGGTDVTEFYVLAADGVAIEGEVEDIGPGLTRDLTVALDAGSFVLACKPGMVGEGIRRSFATT